MARQMREALLAALRQSGLSRYQIAKRTGVQQAILSRFVSRNKDLRLATVEKLAEFLGLELRPADKGRGTKRRARK